MSDVRPYPVWCERCNWNAEPLRRPRLHGRGDRVANRLALAASQSLEREALGRESQRRLTGSLVATYAMALLVHGLTLALLVLAVAALRAGGWGYLGAVVLAGLAWVVRPRPPDPPGNGYTRRDLPATFVLLDRVASGIGAVAPDRVHVGHGFNASFSRPGWRRHRHLRIGLALFELLEPQERVALIGHELGHDVSGDPNRGLVVGTTLETLTRWHAVLDPVDLDRKIDEAAEFPIIVWGMIRAVVAWLVSVLSRGILFVSLRDRQRAEYRADRLAVHAAGTAATASAYRKLALGDTFQRLSGGHAVGRDFLDGWRAAMRVVPGHELARLARVVDAQLPRLDDSHPLAAARLRVVESRPTVPPAVIFTAEESGQVDAELRLVLRPPTAPSP